ncbi:metallophosphoesterase family protein [Rhodohalobacter sulfatireducens]|uniref:Metallophosphoesterase n=1 Tax=Rhodohalobacter sulfatireducens TaxID=2911366 RepID=A0ABS9KH14_9BACT|nr:metallophosphoesterase [Rhodohalobacter sulfatireducens]MCG2590144.1 metallophosphoesterase [Rhodohalobacter sulfatireducens]
MNRLSFLQKAASGLFGIGWISQLGKQTQSDEWIAAGHESFTVSGNHVTFYVDDIKRPVKVIFASDTHLWRDDERGDPYRKYSDRMAKAYNETTHFETGELTNPEECFENIITYTQDVEADLLALPGDLVSWPSEAAIEWAYDKLEKSGVSYIYTAGNHDWHYEGMEGSLEDLRSEWIERRLLPLYQGKNPMMASYEIGGIRFLTIDDSTYQISDEQLAFYRDQTEDGTPTVLMMHIPLYVPGRSVGYGVGHPEWGAATDRNYELERRPRWPESGHTQTTMDFHEEVFNTPNLLGVFAGHIHRSTMESINGIPQFVSDDNASGGYMEIDFKPADSTN